ncbi:MAG TPA: LacI family DNA-binding transcriptional regulator, partial [Pseudolysinimonas sp.]|nr:LacI family DNA-binding transcriptional regulator [Pseudolysinimonas sp.]
MSSGGSLVLSTRRDFRCTFVGKGSPVRSTRAEVARRAGVSPAVVSYVLNGGPRNVAPETRRRVEEAIASLEYRPNAIAQALRGGRSGAIGVVISGDEDPQFHAPFLSLQRAAVAHGFAIYVGYAGDEASERGYVRSLADRQVDALIVVSPRNIEKLVALKQDGVPVALVVHKRLETGLATLEIDSERAIGALVEHVAAGEPQVVMRSTALDGLLTKGRLEKSLGAIPTHNFDPHSVDGARDLLRELSRHGRLAVLCATRDEVERLQWLCAATGLELGQHLFVSAGLDFADGADLNSAIRVRWELDDAFSKLLAELVKMIDE